VKTKVRVVQMFRAQGFKTCNKKEVNKSVLAVLAECEKLVDGEDEAESVQPVPEKVYAPVGEKPDGPVSVPAKDAVKE
jgi:hypothetical protein